MQRLYENHKVLTYPRTDSRYLTSDVVGTLSERLDACAVGPYRKMALTVKAQHPETKKWSFVDNKKVSDHHAIIPTEQFVDLTRSVRRADTKRQLFMQRVEENSSLPEEKS